MGQEEQMKYLWRIVDLIVGGIFIYAGAIKALDPVQFANDIDNYKTLPWFISVRLALYLPWLEIFCGIAIIFRFLYRGGLSILTALIVVFIGATVAAKMRGLDITCGCFGHASKNWNFSTHLVMDSLILAAALALFSRVWRTEKLKRRRLMRKTLSGQRLIVALLVGAFATTALARDRKEWIKLTDCRYVDAPDNDGDSFRVRGGDKEFTARLYYVDAPETNLRLGDRTHDQSLYFGITLDETMKAGEKAKRRTKELLQKPFVIWTRWATAGGRGRESRYYVIIEVDGKSLGEILIGEGLARTKGVAPNLPNEEKGKAYMERLDDLENAAREKHLGAWATSATPTPSPSAAATSSP